MSSAPRDARWMSDASMRLGQSTFSQKWWPSPSGRTSGWPQAGQAAGMRHALAPFGALLLDAADDLGDDVAGPADDDRVADADVLGQHLDLVVEGGVGDRDAGDGHRLEHRERRGLAGAADVDLDGAQDRLLLDRRHLVGDGPAGRLGRGAERAALRHVVDLDDDAVDLEAERVAPLGEVVR